MKTKNICSGLLLGALLISSNAFSQQETVFASAQTIPQDGTEPVAKKETEEVKKEEEEAPKAFSFSGTIDTYFHSSFGVTNPYMAGAYGPSTSFADLKGFGLGMANLIASYSGDKAGFTADLVFGPRGKAAVFGSSQGIVNQMFAYYKLSNKVTLNMGQFNTFLGYEVISPAVNFHYSTSYMFSWGPFNHTGLRADFDLGGGIIGKLAIMNPTDIVEFNPVNTYTLGGQLGKTSDAGGIWLNVLYGDQDGTLDPKDGAFELDEDGAVVLDEDGNPVFVTSAGSLFQMDVTTGWKLSEKFYLGFNGTMQSLAAGESFIAEGDIADSDGDAATFTGFAVYPKITLSETFALGLRAEYLSVTNGHLGIFGTDTKGDGDVMEYTVSGNYKVGGLTFIPEFRIDMTSEDSFDDADGEATNMMPSVSLAAVYKF